MLRRENELRLSNSVQSQYAACLDDFTGKVAITLEVQRRVCHEFGFSFDTEEGVDLLRSATALFPEDDEVKQSAHWLKYNICAPCPISLGTVVPNITTFATDKTPVTLHQICARSEMPTVILAGSFT